MNEHLIDLLLEEYKQDCFFHKLGHGAVDMIRLSVNNRDIVFDIIGFPKESSSQIINQQKKMRQDQTFCRDWLTDYYYGKVGTLPEQKEICLTNFGLEFREQINERAVRLQLSHYVEWLYQELDKYKQGEGEN